MSECQYYEFQTFDRAVLLLADLRDVAARTGRDALLARRLRSTGRKAPAVVDNNRCGCSPTTSFQ